LPKIGLLWFPFYVQAPCMDDIVLALVEYYKNNILNVMKSIFRIIWNRELMSAHNLTEAIKI